MEAIKKYKQNRFILHELVRKSVKTQYRNSFLGMLWTVLNPLLNMLVMWLIFSQFFGRNDPLYPIYLFTGNIMFSALRGATMGGMTSIVNNRGLLLRTKIDTYLFPLASTLSSLVTFAFSFVALVLIMLGMQLFGGHGLFGYQMVFVLLMLPAFLLFEYGISLFLSATYVFFRDISHLYSVFLTLWTYLTPIFYKIDSFKTNSLAYQFVKLNPMYYFVRYFRDAVYNYHYIGWGIPYMPTLGLLYAIGIGSFVIGFTVFKLLKNKFMTNI